jgi:hypothetical protein
MFAVEKGSFLEPESGTRQVNEKIVIEADLTRYGDLPFDHGENADGQSVFLHKYLIGFRNLRDAMVE